MAEKEIEKEDTGKKGLDKKKLRFLILGAVLITVILASVILIPQDTLSFNSKPNTEKTPTPVATTQPSSQPSTEPSKPNPFNGKIESVTFGKENYKAGDTVNAEMKVKNIGEGNITSEKIIIKVKCVELESFGGNMLLNTLSDEEKTKTYTMSFSDVILPGESKTLSASFKTPKEMSGVSLSGEYDLSLTLKVNGHNVDQKNLDLVLH